MKSILDNFTKFKNKIFMYIKNNMYILMYLTVNILGLILYLYFSRNLNYIPNSIIRAVIFLCYCILLICLFNLAKSKEDVKEEKDEIIYLNIIKEIIMALNIYVFIDFIIFHCFQRYYLLIMHISLFLIVIIITMRYFYIVIKKIAKTTYIRILLFSFCLLFLGWFNLQYISLLTMFTLILNTLISVEDRKKIILYLKKKEIGNKWLWSLIDNKGLTEDEQKGEFIVQKIFVYIAIIIFYLVIIYTENKEFSIYIPLFFGNMDLNSIPTEGRLLYKGVDRILLPIIIFVLLILDRSFKKVIKIVFNLK